MDIWTSCGFLSLFFILDQLSAQRLFKLNVGWLGRAATQAGALRAGIGGPTARATPDQFDMAKGFAGHKTSFLYLLRVMQTFKFRYLS